MKLESIALHHGYTSEETTKAATTPIYQTTSFTFDNTQHGADLFDLKVEGNIYSRIGNPTNTVLEKRVAEMEAVQRWSNPIQGRTDWAAWRWGQGESDAMDRDR